MKDFVSKKLQKAIENSRFSSSEQSSERHDPRLVASQVQVAADHSPLNFGRCIRFFGRQLHRKVDLFCVDFGENSSDLLIASRFRVKTGDEDIAVEVASAAQRSVKSAKGSK